MYDLWEEHLSHKPPIKNEEKCHHQLKPTTNTLKQNIKDINIRK